MNTNTLPLEILEDISSNLDVKYQHLYIKI
jgi:hypothetical protein